MLHQDDSLATAPSAAATASTTERPATPSSIVTGAQAANVSAPHRRPRQAEPLPRAELSCACSLIRRPGLRQKWTHRVTMFQTERYEEAACPIRNYKPFYALRK